MCILEYPKEIQELIDAFNPYRKDILANNCSSVPNEAMTAYKKFKKWAWEQEQ